MKVILYFLSLQFLYVLIFILTFKIKYLYHIKLLKNPLENYSLIINFFSNAQEIVFFSSIIFLITGIILYFYLTLQLNKNGNLPFEIINLNNNNYDYSSFISVYIIPLVAFDYTSFNYFIFLIVYLLMMGIIYIKTCQFYTNPTLLLWGYHIYKIETKINNKNQCLIVISKDNLSINDYIKYIKLTNNIVIGKINI